jgi:hypothetical protein
MVASVVKNAAVAVMRSAAEGALVDAGEDGVGPVLIAGLLRLDGTNYLSAYDMSISRASACALTTRKLTDSETSPDQTAGSLSVTHSALA